MRPRTPADVQTIRATERRGEKRRATIRAYIAREQAAGRATPTVAQVARLYAMSRTRVEFHFRVLGLA